ncbi:hypothetical protein [Palaeococcus ferrophilus]|uniref:hypothetical protein n=1 Tax=Palaeococcus ferrophilus TaxID=83868 RepID=UPI00064E38A4|nr:hypothetical protein [Palaeococcus ferrophilus]
MARRWHLYAKVLIKNILIFVIAVLIFGAVVVKGYEKTTFYNNSDVFDRNYRIVLSSLDHLRQASELRMTPGNTPSTSPKRSWGLTISDKT